MRRLAAAALLIAAIDGRAQTPPRLHVGLFGDVIFGRELNDRHTLFETGEIDPYATYRFSDRWTVVGEGLLQHVRRGVDADEPSKHFEADLERLYVSYARSDRLRIELGQMHTGLVAWNQREHRSRFLQTPIDVPSIARGEEQGGAWPLHFVGAWADGRLPGSLGLTYGGGIGETRGRSRDEVQPFVRGTGDAVLFSVSVAPDTLAGLEGGFSAYRGGIPAPDGRLREYDATFSAGYVRDAIEIRGEWAEMRHERSSDGRRYRTHGWYALASYRWASLRPYVLLDHLRVAHDEVYLRDLHDQSAAAVGLRWDLTRWLAAKTDLRSRSGRSGNRDRELRMQLAFSF